MLLGVTIILGVLNQAPVRVQLTPNLLKAAPTTEPFLSAESAGEKHSEPGWIVAGVASGAMTATLLTLNLRHADSVCPENNLPGSNTGRYVGFWAIPIAVGAALGTLAAHDVPAAKGTSIGIDIAMPVLGGLSWLIPACIH